MICHFSACAKVTSMVSRLFLDGATAKIHGKRSVSTVTHPLPWVQVARTSIHRSTILTTIRINYRSCIHYHFNNKWCCNKQHLSKPKLPVIKLNLEKMITFKITGL